MSKILRTYFWRRLNLTRSVCNPIFICILIKSWILVYRCNRLLVSRLIDRWQLEMRKANIYYRDGDGCKSRSKSRLSPSLVSSAHLTNNHASSKYLESGRSFSVNLPTYMVGKWFQRAHGCNWRRISVPFFLVQISHFQRQIRVKSILPCTGISHNPK